MDLRQSQEYAKYLKSIGWLVEKINEDYIYIRKIPLTPFSIIKIQRPRKIPFQKIEKIVKKYRAFAIYLEPNFEFRITNHELKKRGYGLSKSPFLPTKTTQLDLIQLEEKILAGMKKDARYELRKAEKEAVQLIKVKDLTKFHRAWKRSVDWRRYVPSLKSLKHLQKKTAYYYYAFSSKEGRRKSAQYLLVWEAIKLAKKRGCKIFDFEGIYDERFPIKAWKGFSHFKKSFGGKIIQYPGCFVKYQLPL